jgi:hypothetical protein
MIPPSEYLFCDASSPYIEDGNEQGGVAKRSFLSVRLDNVDEATIHKLNEYYKRLDEANKLHKKCEYGTIFYILTNWFRQYMGWSQKGNCAYWTSSGLAEAGLLSGNTNWPLYLFFKMLFTQINRNGLQDINVIAYKNIKRNEPDGAYIYPFSKFMWDLDSIATVVVEPRLVEVSDTNDKYIIDVTRHNNEKYRGIVEKWLELRNKLSWDVVSQVRF